MKTGKDDKNDAFFIRKVTQSEYRKQKSVEKEDSKKQYLDLALKGLNIKDEAVKEDIKQRIKASQQHLVGLLLPEDIDNKSKMDRYLEELYIRLGLS